MEGWREEGHNLDIGDTDREEQQLNRVEGTLETNPRHLVSLSNMYHSEFFYLLGETEVAPPPPHTHTHTT